jgi:hypothetical protein
VNELFSNGAWTFGTGGFLGLVLLWMWRLLIISDRRTAADRLAYQAAADAAAARATAEINRINRDHDAELVELRQARKEENARLEAKVELLTAQVEALNVKFDAERNARRAAEDTASRLTSEQRHAS